MLASVVRKRSRSAWSTSAARWRTARLRANSQTVEGHQAQADGERDDGGGERDPGAGAGDLAALAEQIPLDPLHLVHLGADRVHDLLALAAQHRLSRGRERPRPVGLEREEIEPATQDGQLLARELIEPQHAYGLGRVVEGELPEVGELPR